MHSETAARLDSSILPESTLISNPHCRFYFCALDAYVECRHKFLHGKYYSSFSCIKCLGVDAFLTVLQFSRISIVVWNILQGVFER